MILKLNGIIKIYLKLFRLRLRIQGTKALVFKTDKEETIPIHHQFGDQDRLIIKTEHYHLIYTQTKKLNIGSIHQICK